MDHEHLGKPPEDTSASGQSDAGGSAATGLAGAGSVLDLQSQVESMKSAMQSQLDSLTSAMDKMNARVTNIRGADFQSQNVNEDVGADEAAAADIVRQSHIATHNMASTFERMAMADHYGLLNLGLTVMGTGAQMLQMVAAGASGSRVVHGDYTPKGSPREVTPQG